VTPARCGKVKEVGQGFALKLATEAPVNGGREIEKYRVRRIIRIKRTY